MIELPLNLTDFEKEVIFAIEKENKELYKWEITGGEINCIRKAIKLTQLSMPNKNEMDCTRILNEEGIEVYK